LPVRLLKDPEFDRWARKEGLTDQMLRAAADEIERGLVDARLGGFLLKKRVARPGRGRSSGYRTILAHRQGSRLIFLHGFAKNEKDNITRREHVALLALGDQYMGYSEATITDLVAKGLLVEVV
jgi:hypothetical protein